MYGLFILVMQERERTLQPAIVSRENSDLCPSRYQSTVNITSTTYLPGHVDLACKWGACSLQDPKLQDPETIVTFDPESVTYEHPIESVHGGVGEVKAALRMRRGVCRHVVPDHRYRLGLERRASTRLFRHLPYRETSIGLRPLFQCRRHSTEGPALHSFQSGGVLRSREPRKGTGLLCLVLGSGVRRRDRV